MNDRVIPIRRSHAKVRYRLQICFASHLPKIDRKTKLEVNLTQNDNFSHISIRFFFKVSLVQSLVTSATNNIFT